MAVFGKIDLDDRDYIALCVITKPAYHSDVLNLSN